jgi:hypothetical protein
MARSDFKKYPSSDGVDHKKVVTSLQMRHLTSLAFSAVRTGTALPLDKTR